MFERMPLRADGTPLYVQIRQQVLAMIGRGELRPGQQLPTVRAASAMLSVNPSVVQQAFEDLQRDGAVITQRGRGTFVAEEPTAQDAAVMAVRFETLAHQTVAEARIQGLDPAEVGRRVTAIAEDSS